MEEVYRRELEEVYHKTDLDVAVREKRLNRSWIIMRRTSAENVGPLDGQNFSPPS